jgi:hypothetical protein
VSKESAEGGAKREKKKRKKVEKKKKKIWCWVCARSGPAPDLQEILTS